VVKTDFFVRVSIQRVARSGDENGDGRVRMRELWEKDICTGKICQRTDVLYYWMFRHIQWK